ncbi:MAG: DUF952 domain-containing protein [Hyphomicrobiaceae bacterium]
MNANHVYKICSREAWDQALGDGAFVGSEIDRADGFIHFSSARQVAETAAKHFRGQIGLVIVAFDPADFGASLKWEPSRGGQLFPHLYGELDPKRAVWLDDLVLDDEGCPMIPERVSSC